MILLAIAPGFAETSSIPSAEFAPLSNCLVPSLVTSTNFGVGIAPLSVTVDDFNSDGYLDVLMVGNTYSTEVSTGRYDATTGSYLEGDGRGNFKSINALASGFFSDGDAKGMAKLTTVSGDKLILIGNNSSPLKTFRVQQNSKYILIESDDVFASITTRSGKKYKQEFYYGSTYLSQSSRELFIPNDAASIEIFNMKGERRKIAMQ